MLSKIAKTENTRHNVVLKTNFIIAFLLPKFRNTKNTQNKANAIIIP